MTAILKNDRVLKALQGLPVDRTPVWIMRQAGRYLPEYREVRKKAGSFLTLCKTPELACEVTMQPLARFDLDAAIIFSDILTIPDAMNLGLRFEEGEGPVFDSPVRTKNDIDQLSVASVDRTFDYLIPAIQLVLQSLDGKVPLLGFSGSPWTLACYMVEGKGSKTFSSIKKMIFSDPMLAHALLEKLADAVAVYLNGQIAAGVHAVMLFDTWGGMLAFDDYDMFSLQYIRRVISQLKTQVDGRKVPVIVFAKGVSNQIQDIARSGCDAVSVDWTLSLGKARAMVGDEIALQGNLDPSVLYAPVDVIREKVRRYVL